MKQDLAGKKVVVTRTRSQASSLTELLSARGAEVIEIPTISIEPPKDRIEFAAMVTEVHTYDWLIFSSPNGVEQFFTAFFKAYDDSRSIGGLRIAAVGPSTAKKIREYRYAVDLMPETAFVAEGLVKTFAERECVENLTMLWVHAEAARTVISDGLQAQGAILDECIAYKTVAVTGDPTGGIKKLEKGGADVITFASSSAVTHFFKLGLKLPDDIKLVSMGPVTTATLKALGKECVEADTSTLDGLADAVGDVLSD